MKLEDTIAVITGGAGGIGRALALAFKTAGARAVAVADLPTRRLEKVAEEVGGPGVACDVSRESDVRRLVETVERDLGPIDVFVSNAGLALLGDEHAPDEEWQRCWDVHVMAHVYAARAVAGRMAARGDGYLLNTASAAGLLTHVQSATYSVTKHAAVAFAEFLSITYGPRGVKVSVLCPQAVRTAMTEGREHDVASVDGMMEPGDLARHVVEAMDREEFLILPHPQVLEYVRRKTGDYDRWLRGMQRLRQKYV